MCDTLVLELLSWTDQHNIYPGSHDYHNRRVWTVTDLWGVAKSQQTRATRCGLDKYDALLTLLRASFSYFYGFPGVEGGGGGSCVYTKVVEPILTLLAPPLVSASVRIHFQIICRSHGSMIVKKNSFDFFYFNKKILKRVSWDQTAVTGLACRSR